ncbi:GspE/PulE family protein [Patescibacteria group bacterium]|nr:GspE/PulE family protein [Patescibacteria group bacterium]MBU1519087.1 GspE/PulE family protein [Patescibacteria group bacterium]MBU2416897.1 GspE/PulE family protein [Patescibacteria group bacterium]MBU2461054.1 GspE/PulE family protein [Patescibacteria group bacterium]
MTFLSKLIKQEHIKEQDVQEILDIAERENKLVSEVLQMRGVPEQTILNVLSESTGAPIRKIQDKKIPFEILRYVSEESSTYYKLLPLAVVNGVLEVGMVDPEDMEARDALQFIALQLKFPFKIFLISQKDFEKGVLFYRGLTEEVTEALTQFEATEDEDIKLDKNTDIKEADNKKTGILTESTIKEDAPITKIVSVMLRHATAGNASDIHVEPLFNRVRIRFRVDGELFTSIFLPNNVHSAVIARIKILANLKLDEKRKPQDGRFTARIEGRKVDFRVSTFPTQYGEKVVMRILDQEKGIRTLEELGLSVSNLSLLKKSIQAPYGIILITGPTGSGKSTTLYSMLNAIDCEKFNVVSLEDPIEYNIPGISQSQVQPQIGYTFATGLRSILRQDPDIIMVGEIRDKETAHLAIHAALTGHLVFATLHTNNAIGAIPRLVDMGIDPYLISPTLIMAIAQRLIRVLPQSKESVPVDESFQIMIDKQFVDLPMQFKEKLNLKGSFYRAKTEKKQTLGMSGRVAVLEILEITNNIKNVILTNPTEAAIWKVARENGMLTMKEDAIIKAFGGMITFEEANTL